MPAWAGNGDWYTGPTSGSFSGTQNAPCDCGTIPGRLDYEGFNVSVGPGTKLTMEGHIEVRWDGQELGLCQSGPQPGSWTLTMEFFRGEGSCDNNQLKYDLHTDVTCSGVARQANPADPQWWWNSLAEIEVDSITISYATTIGGTWQEVYESEQNVGGAEVWELRAAGGDAGNPYGVGPPPQNKQGTPTEILPGGDTLNNSPANHPNYPWPHSVTTITYPPVDPYTDTRERWRLAFWEAPATARHIKLEIKLSGTGGGTHGDNCIVVADALQMDLKVEGEMQDPD